MTENGSKPGITAQHQMEMTAPDYIMEDINNRHSGVGWYWAEMCCQLFWLHKIWKILLAGRGPHFK